MRTNRRFSTSVLKPFTTRYGMRGLLGTATWHDGLGWFDFPAGEYVRVEQA